MKRKIKKKGETKRDIAQNAKIVRWRAFAEFIAQGKSGTQAYRLAGYSKGNEHSDGANAARLLRNAQVQEMVEVAKEKASSARIATAKDLKEFWTGVMRGEVKDVEVDDGGVLQVPPKLADRIRASDCLARTLALFKEKTDGKLIVTIRRGGDSAASLQKREIE